MRRDRGVGPQRAAVELGRREGHDRLVHAVLHVETARYAVAVQTDQPLQQADAEALARGLLRQHRRRQLAVVAGQHDAVAAQQRHPAARLRRLTRLVDDQQVEAPAAEHFAVQPRGRRAQDRGRVRGCVRRPGPPGGGRRRAARGPPGACRGGRRVRAWPASTCAALRNRANASFTNLRAWRTSGWSSTIRSSVCSRSCGRTRAGWPRRTACSPWASSRSSRLSTARLLGAQTSTLSPRRTAWRINSTSVVVLPVPGGPWTAATSRRRQGEAHGLALRLVQRLVQRGEVGCGRERRRRLAQQDAAQLGETVALGRARPRSSACRWRSRAVSSSARSRRKTVPSSASSGSLKATRSSDSSRSQTTPRRPGSRAPPWRDSSTGEPTCNRVHGSAAPVRLPKRHDDAAAQAGGLVAHDQIEQAVAAALGLGGGQPADALQRLPGLRLRFQSQQGGQAPKMFVRWDHERKEDSPQRHKEHKGNTKNSQGSQACPSRIFIFVFFVFLCALCVFVVNVWGLSLRRGVVGRP